MDNKIEIKNGQITIENLQELTNKLNVRFENIVVFLTNKQLTSLNYLFILDMKELCNGYTIETITLEKNKYGDFVIKALGHNNEFLTLYTLYTIISIE